jgi:hypothetical protein
MTRRSAAGALFSLLTLVASAVALAQPAADVQDEVRQLLDRVEASGCQFERNGTWYDALTAKTHLQDKYRYLAARGQITTTEDFIEKAATRSSISGQPYHVRCKDGAPTTSARWLSEELLRLRSH